MGALFKVLFGWLMRFFGKFAGPILGNVLLFFGFNFVSYSFAIQPFVQLIQSSLSGAPALAVQCIAFLQLDKAITIILSAHVSRAAGKILFRKKESS